MCSSDLSANHLSLQDVSGFDFNDMAAENRAQMAIEANLLAYADSAHVDKDENAAKQFTAWTWLAFRLKAEKLSAMLTGIKSTIDREIANGHDELEGLGGWIAAEMIIQLEAAKKSKKIDDDSYNRAMDSLRSISGVELKKI